MGCSNRVHFGGQRQQARERDPVWGFADLRFEDFLISAVARGPALRDAKRASVGETILKAIRDTQRFVSYNTNLGIVLLFVPLVKTYGPSISGKV